MAAPNETQGTSPAPGAATTPGSGGPAGAAVSDPKDYEARLRSGGEWTVEETRRQQQRADRAENELRQIEQQLGGLRQILKAGGMNGDQIAAHLSTWQELRRDPERAAAIDAAIRGQAPAKPKAEPDDDYVDPEVKELREKVAEFERKLSEQSTFSGQQALTRHFEAVAEKLGLEGDDFDGVRQKLIQTLQTSPDMSRSLMSERGQKAVEVLVMDALGLDGMQKLAEKRLLRTHEIRHSMETDGPTRAVSADTPPPPVYKTPHEAAIASLRLARANPSITRGTRA